jgi:enoyl-CoA hydratase/carnithine racemase
MSKVVLEEHGLVAVLRMTHGVTNAINAELVDELLAATRKVGERYRGLVVAGNAKFFSIGLDLPKLLNFDRDEMFDFWTRFEDLVLALYTLPIPTAGALAGHAIAGGAILALACDFRFAAAGRKLIGLNEVRLGVPVPYLGDRMLRQVAGDRVATEMEYYGKLVGPEEAKAVGLVDGVFPEEDVSAQALARIEELAALPPHGFALAKQHRVADVRAQFLAARKPMMEEFLRCWFAAPTRVLLEEAAKKF